MNKREQGNVPLTRSSFVAPRWWQDQQFTRAASCGRSASHRCLYLLMFKITQEEMQRMFLHSRCDVRGSCSSCSNLFVLCGDHRSSSVCPDTWQAYMTLTYLPVIKHICSILWCSSNRTLIIRLTLTFVLNWCWQWLKHDRGQFLFIVFSISICWWKESSEHGSGEA